jgi:hypothetical protein
VYIFGRDQGLRPNVYIQANKLNAGGLKFVKENGSTDMFEDKVEKNQFVLY